jgi:hypothetical protein
MAHLTQQIKALPPKHPSSMDFNSCLPSKRKIHETNKKSNTEHQPKTKAHFTWFKYKTPLCHICNEIESTDHTKT